LPSDWAAIDTLTSPKSSTSRAHFKLPSTPSGWESDFELIQKKPEPSRNARAALPEDRADGLKYSRGVARAAASDAVYVDHSCVK
jgi:hypothetical protein